MTFLRIVCLFLVACALNIAQTASASTPDCDDYRFDAEHNAPNQGPLPRLNIRKADSLEKLGAFGQCVAQLDPLKLEAIRVDEGRAHSIKAIDKRAYVAQERKWKDGQRGVTRQGNSTTGILSFQVCWHEVDDRRAFEKRLVQVAVWATWEQHLNIRFVGWKPCGPERSAISITFSSDISKSEIGSRSRSRIPSMHLQLEYPAASGNDFCVTNTSQCLWATAVHEFGHALYFLHEHQRSDAQDSSNGDHAECLVREAATDTSGASPLDAANEDKTQYDKYSVMNYCANLYETRLQLSDCDIAAGQDDYQAPTQSRVQYEPVCQILK